MLYTDIGFILLGKLGHFVAEITRGITVELVLQFKLNTIHFHFVLDVLVIISFRSIPTIIPIVVIIKIIVSLNSFEQFNVFTVLPFDD